MTDRHVGASGHGRTPSTQVVVYWRPHCGFCAGLLRALERIGLEFERRNIWDDEDAAARVRGVTGGSETVPTVLVGEHALVNPSADEVLQVLAEADPAAVPDGWTRRLH